MPTHEVLYQFSTYLEITKIRARGIKEADGRELNSRVKTHELETTEACHKSSSTLAIEMVSSDFGSLERSSHTESTLARRKYRIAG